jgi:uncharacterized protein (DUF1697 family)
MNKYISILRGINVSGQKKIKMTDLKALYESLDFQNVVTYIQSGNVIFDTLVDSTDDLKITIEKAIEEKYKFHVPVEIRTNHEIENIIRNCPFGSVNLVEDGTKVLVTFLSSEPQEVMASDIQKYVVAPEKLVVRGKEVYLHCPNGYGKTKLSNTFIEKKLKVEATTRNWKSVHKLHELSM